MARGKEGKAARKTARKNERLAVQEMLDHEFGAPGAGKRDDDDDDEDDDDEPEELFPNAGGGDKGDDEDDSDEDEIVLPTPKKKSKASGAKKESKYTNKALRAASASAGPKSGIKTTPLILLIMMTATTLIPVMIYASDYLGSLLAKNNVMGSIGYRLGIGSTPKKRVLSFYEKHDPAKISEVPKILSKYYGDYPKLIKNLERKYQDYGYFMDWEQDEAPLTLALEQVVETREYLISQFNTYAPQPIKKAARNVQYNVGTLVKKFKKVWKKTLWPMLEPILGVPKGAAAQKRKDAAEARKRKAAKSKTKRRNTEYRDDIEDEH